MGLRFSGWVSGKSAVHRTTPGGAIRTWRCDRHDHGAGCARLLVDRHADRLVSLRWRARRENGGRRTNHRSLRAGLAYSPGWHTVVRRKPWRGLLQKRQIPEVADSL